MTRKRANDRAQAPLAAFDLIRVINLPTRTDRRRQMVEELRRVGLLGDPRVEFFPAIAVEQFAPFRSKGEMGVFLSHLQILREAAERKASVLILEDDADFTASFPSHQTTACEGIFYGGYEASKPADLPSSDIIGAHCMGFSSGVTTTLVPYLIALLDHPSPPPIDGAYVWYRRTHPEVPTFFAVPPIAVQRPSRSDIAQLRLFDRLPVIREAAGLARRLKRRLTRTQ